MRDFNNHRVGGKAIRSPAAYSHPGLAFLVLRPHPFPDHCGPALYFLPYDHMPFRDAVVRPCISCFGTTCFPGSLWSGLVFLTLGPHAFPDHCGPALYFLLYDHMPFRDAVVRPCFPCLWTTSSAEETAFYCPGSFGQADIFSSSPASSLLISSGSSFRLAIT